MNPRLDKAERWSCDRCGVCVSQVTGELTHLPANWARTAGGQFCLTCRRERAGEAALDAAKPGMAFRDRAQLRRDGVLEFEVSRDPERSNAEIARACRTTAPAIVKTRERLGLDEADPAWSGRAASVKAR